MKLFPDTTFERFLDQIIEDGIAAAMRDYPRSPKLEGSVAGFVACRRKTVEQLEFLLRQAGHDQREAHRRQAEDYWYWRCREAEIEWVCNVVSAALMNEGQPTIITPTVRGVMKAAEILGVSDT